MQVVSLEKYKIFIFLMESSEAKTIELGEVNIKTFQALNNHYVYFMKRFNHVKWILSHFNYSKKLKITKFSITHIYQILFMQINNI